MRGSYDYDIVMMSDFRYPGGTSASQVEEIRAQAAAGYSTGLIHVPSPRLGKERPFHRGIAACLDEGLADLVVATDEVSARMLLVRHPVVLSKDPSTPCVVRADKKLLIANQPPRNPQGESVYDVSEVNRNARRLLGGEIEWAPIGPLVRDALLAEGADIRIQADDWANIIDPAVWAPRQERPASPRPVIGRHSRSDWRKWPSTADELLAAYPSQPAFEVRVLGGAEHPIEVLGRCPDNWTVYEFNEIEPRDFLRGLDFFVYFHHPELIEAFGRSILEAMAAGVVCIVPKHFERVFGEGCLYASPGEVQGIVSRLHADRDAYEAQAEAGLRLVRERYSYAAHVERLRSALGPGSGKAKRRTNPSKRARPERTVLFVSSNGTGVGHITRLMAMARRCSPTIRPIFLTLSQAVSTVRDEGFLVEHMPSAKALAAPTGPWNHHFARRLSEVIETHGVDGVVFDGTMPYRGVIAARGEHPRIPFIWSRRAMWKRCIGEGGLERASHFDLVVQPGELPGAQDGTPAVPAEIPTVTVPPIVFARRSELLSRGEARDGLQISEEETAVLVQLGAGNNVDLDHFMNSLLSALTEIPKLRLFLVESPIAAKRITPPPGATVLRLYPMAPHYPAFDFSVSAAGYNTFHEVIRFGLPTVFVPNPRMPTDDQTARARSASERGAALCVEDYDVSQLTDAVRKMNDRPFRELLRKGCESLAGENGANPAARELERVVSEWALRRPFHESRRDAQVSRDLAPQGRRLSMGSLMGLVGDNSRRLERFGAAIPEGRLRVPGRRTATRMLGRLARVAEEFERTALPVLPAPGGVHLRAGLRLPVVALVCLGRDMDTARELIEQTAKLQVARRSFAPLFVLDQPAQAQTRRHGYACEYLLSQKEWRRHVGQEGWRAYVERRLALVRAAYAPVAVVVMSDWRRSSPILLGV